MTVAEPASVLAAVSVIAGIGIALIQLRHLARQRQVEMVLRAFGPFLDPAFSRAFWTVQAWQFGSYEEFERNATIGDQPMERALAVALDRRLTELGERHEPLVRPRQ